MYYFHYLGNCCNKSPYGFFLSFMNLLYDVLLNVSCIPEDRPLCSTGVKFYCSICGEEGHRRHYCSTLRENSTPIRFRCRKCGKLGHNRRTCGKSKSDRKPQEGSQSASRHCSLCGQNGHNRRTCTELNQPGLGNSCSETPLISVTKRTHSCRLCLGKGHNSRSCPKREAI